MTGPKPFDVTGGLLAVGLAVLFAGGAFFGLSRLATPADFSTRVAAADAQISAAEMTLKAPHRADAYGPGALCSGSVEDAAGALKSQLQSLATANGLTLASVTMVTAPPGQDDLALSAVTMQFDATGRYDQLLAMLGALARARPQLFIDTADLTSQVSSVDFKFSGRLYCSAHL